jgi:predicted dehydrogenase
MIKFGVIGYGYWGPNVVRNLDLLDKTEVLAVCDKSPASRKRAQKAYPSLRVTSDSSELMSSKDLDAIAVITPVWTHYELTKAALEHGKHVFVEKPFTSNSAQAEELINLAAKKNLKIMVDHTFLFTGAVKKIRQLLKEGALGNLYYYDSTRVNLGLFQHDVNVIWDLAPHDLSIIDHLIAETPEAVVATGQTHLNGFEDVAFITLSSLTSMSTGCPRSRCVRPSSGGRKRCWCGMISKPTRKSRSTTRASTLPTSRDSTTCW